MADLKQIKRWKITETLLERARGALPDFPADRERECAALLAEYREFLEHDQLGQAFDALEQLGRLVPARGGFWRDLERVAETMGLIDRLPALRKAFTEAVPPKSR